MKRLLWPGLLFLSTSWLFFIPIFNLPAYNMGITFLIIGILFCTFAFWKQDFKKLDKKYLLILLPLLLSICIIPLPYSIGPIVLTIATLLYGALSISDNEKANWIILGVSFSGVVLTLQTMFLPVYSIFVSHGHRVDALSSIISSAGNLLGLKTSVNSGILFVQTHQQTWAITTTWEKLGFFPWFNIFIGAMLVFCFISKPKKIAKNIIVLLILSLIYLVLRYILILFIFMQNKNVSILWDQILLTVSFLPFVFLLMKFLPLNKIKLDLDGFKKLKLGKKQLAAMLLTFIFIFSLVGTFAFQDPGTEKQGRILIDEVHSEWEDSVRPIDKEWYGMLSTYNYYCWAEWLDKYYMVERNEDKLLTSSLLNNYDVLILKCPTNLYSDQEINDITQFVKNGGGLYMIGDHTNVFGMNYYLNMVSENFGITYLSDSTYELGTGMTSNYKPESMFPHPVVQNMEEFGFLTSCTLSAPINSENVIIGNRLLGEPGTYATENFFRENHESLDIEYGLLLQVVAVKHGKGRVLAFTDSTCFSNFCMFMDGYKDFNLGVIEYLNRENTYSYLNTVFTAIAIVSLIIALYIMRNEKKAHILFVFLLIGILAFSCATPVFTSINTSNYQLPSAHSDYTKICFEQEHSDAVIKHSPSMGFSNENDLYGTFFVWVQRVGYFPALEKTLTDAMDNGDVVVIINPIKSFTDEKIEQITDYVKQGGEILLMDSALNTKSTANELLQNFDMQLSYETTNHRLYNESSKEANNTDSNATTSIGNITIPYLKINGGEQTFLTERNETSIAVAELEKGKIVVVVDSYTFNDNVMGGTFTEPDSVLRSVYDLEYYIFEELLLN